MTESGGNWERSVIEKLALEALKEQKRARRWGIFFKLLTFAYLTFLLVMFLDWRGDADRLAGTTHTALVDVIGVIDSGGASATRQRRAAERVWQEHAGVIPRVNSPGGAWCRRESFTRSAGWVEKHPNIPMRCRR
jgi:protease-4